MYYAEGVQGRAEVSGYATSKHKKRETTLTVAPLSTTSYLNFKNPVTLSFYSDKQS